MSRGASTNSTGCTCTVDAHGCSLRAVLGLKEVINTGLSVTE